MALDLQQRQTQHGYWRDHPCHETENSRVILRAGPINSGGITHLLSVAWSTKTPGELWLKVGDGPDGRHIMALLMRRNSH